MNKKKAKIGGISNNAPTTADDPEHLRLWLELLSAQRRTDPRWVEWDRMVRSGRKHRNAETDALLALVAEKLKQTV